MGARADRRPAWVLAFLALAGAIPVLRTLLVADVNWCYPYMASDSYDWINNGLYWAGASLLPTLRPPGYAFLIAGLWKLGALPWLPVVNFMFLGAGTAALYLLLRERHDGWIAVVACWFYFANDFVQDFARYVMAETCAVPFFILATLAFVRAERQPRWYLALGAALSAAFLFSYAALPAAAGFGVALLATRRHDLANREAWKAAALFVLTVGLWFAFRAWYHHAHPGGPHHDVEAMLHLSVSNVRFFGFAAVALVGLVPLPLYVRGAAAFLERSPGAEAWRAAIVMPAASIAALFFFVYDWADKRFLLYLFPFLIVCLAEGLEKLRAWAARGAVPAAAACAFLMAALLWNQIRYPSYGIRYLALTPRDFLEATVTVTKAQKTELHLAGARVVRIHASLLAGFSRGLFDPRPAPIRCATDDPSYTCLATLRAEADTLLRRGERIGLDPPAGWPGDYYVQTNRLGNAFLRPVGLPRDAAVAFVGRERTNYGAPVAACGPYALVRMR
jgi:Dolichyl-phosphate-mannose-protein mannosyltransferase